MPLAVVVEGSARHRERRRFVGAGFIQGGMCGVRARWPAVYVRHFEGARGHTTLGERSEQVGEVDAAARVVGSPGLLDYNWGETEEEMRDHLVSLETCAAVGQCAALARETLRRHRRATLHERLVDLLRARATRRAPRLRVRARPA